MQQNPCFTLKIISGVPHLLPLGQMVADLRRGLRLNETGRFLWEQLSEPLSFPELLSLCQEHYDVTDEELPAFEKDIRQFTDTLLSGGFLLEDTVLPETLLANARTAQPHYFHIAGLTLRIDAPAELLHENLMAFHVPQTSCSDSAEQSRTSVESAESNATLSLSSNGTSDAFLATEPDLHLVITDLLPVPAAYGELLITNPELRVLSGTVQYRLFFPSFEDIAEARIQKDGTRAVIYCRRLPRSYKEADQTNGSTAGNTATPATDTANHTTNAASQTTDAPNQTASMTNKTTGTAKPSLQEELFHILRHIFLYTAQQHGCIALHSASLLYQGRAWLFSASSGTGKSTHTNLWKEHYGTPLLNGDLNLLAFENGQPVVHGIPWCGTSGIFTEKTHPLGGIFLLKRATTDSTEALTEEEKRFLVFCRMVSPAWTEEQLSGNLAFADRLAEKILLARLLCTKNPSAAAAAKEEIDQYLF